MEDLQEQFKAIRKGNLQAFEAVFRHFYEDLFFHAHRLVGQRETAEELVQDLFIYLWQNRSTLVIPSSPKAYLYTAVRNRAFNYLKSRTGRITADLPLEAVADVSAPADSSLNEEQLRQLIQEGIDRLPEKCRLIFHLSREAGMSYQDIARELDISRETVKTQIKIALQKLRQFLGDHWDALLWCSLVHRWLSPEWIPFFHFF